MTGTLSIELWKGSQTAPDQMWSMVDHAKLYLRGEELYLDRTALEIEGNDTVKFITYKAMGYMDLAIEKAIEGYTDDYHGLDLRACCFYIPQGPSYQAHVEDIENDFAEGNSPTSAKIHLYDQKGKRNFFPEYLKIKDKVLTKFEKLVHVAAFGLLGYTEETDSDQE